MVKLIESVGYFKYVTSKMSFYIKILSYKWTNKWFNSLFLSIANEVINVDANCVHIKEN